MKKTKAFTLIELMVTLTVIAIMTGFSIIGLNSIRQKSQDTDRLSSLRQLEVALESYKAVNGKYPEAGDQATSNYISNLTPSFITKLPTENGSGQSGNSGFKYSVSTDQKSYCLRVKGTVFKPESQPDLVDSANTKTWKVCKGSNTSSL